MNPFFNDAETPWAELGGGIRRKCMGMPGTFAAPCLNGPGVVAPDAGSPLLDPFSPRREADL